MNPIEITRKIKEVAENLGYEPTFFSMIYYTEYKEAIFFGNSDEKKEILSKYLKRAIECPRCYPCIRDGMLDIYSAQWIDGTIVLASETPGFIPIKVLDETIKQLGIGIEAG